MLHSASGFALEANEIFKLADPSVVVVHVSDRQGKEYGLGSGIIIGARDVITSCHVVENAAGIAVKQGSVQRSAKLRYLDAARDLCQVQLDDEFSNGRAVTAFVMSRDVEVGQTVFAIGSPRGLEHSISRGIVSGLREMKEEAGSLIQTDAPISPGSSGGGLFDSQGRLIGIVTFQFKDAQNLNFAIPADWIGELATRNRDRLVGVPRSTAVDGKSERPAAEVGAPEFLHAGDFWKYRVTFGRREVGTIKVQIIEMRGKVARERVTYDQSKGYMRERDIEVGFNPTKFPPVVVLPGGYQLTDLSPYADPETPFKAGQKWRDVAGEFAPQGGSNTKSANSVVWIAGMESVRVPAGEFKAWKIETTSESIYAVNHFFEAKCTYWYAPEVKRTVKMNLYMKTQTDAYSSNETYELVSFEQGK
jgi:S1-C subfamily serine protease